MERIRWGNPPVGLFNFPVEQWAATGRFGDYGVELTTHTHLTGQEYGAQIRAGAYDMGQIGTPVFLPAALGSDEYAVISIGLCNYAPFYLVAAPGVGSLADCRGEPVIINKRWTCPGSLLEWHARQENMALDDIQVVELMARTSFDNYGMAFVDGIERQDFRAGILYEPYVSLAERAYGWSVLAAYPKLLRPANYAILLYARRSLIDRKPDLVQRVMGAYFDAATDALAHVDTALKPFAEAFPKVQPMDIEKSVEREAGFWNRGELVDRDLLNRVQQELIHQHLVPDDYQIADYVQPLH